MSKVNFGEAKASFAKLNKAIQASLIYACHDYSDSSIGVALAEISLVDDLGANVDLSLAKQSGIKDEAELLFSESPSRFVISIASEQKETALAAQMAGKKSKFTTLINC